MGLSAGFRLETNRLNGFIRENSKQLERAVLYASDQLALESKNQIRSAMQSANLGRLGYAIANDSDQKKTGRVYYRQDGFSASGNLFIRGKSERTRGAIRAYTEGADILPQKGAWLWIATPEMYQRAKLPQGGRGRGVRMTPAVYNRRWKSTLGPLVEIPGKSGKERLLVVRDITVRSAAGDRPRPLPKRGGVRAGRKRVDQFVAFVGIKKTSRAARINARSIINQVIRQNRRRLITEGLARGAR